jgi:hypothetical protein
MPERIEYGISDKRLKAAVSLDRGCDGRSRNHAASEPGPDIDLAGEMKRSGLAAICATDYQPGDAYDRFLKGWRLWIGS